MNSRGFALSTVITLMVVVLILGISAMYMSEMGFRSISAEARWHMAEKAANRGLLETVRNVVSSGECSISTSSVSYGPVLVQLRAVRGGKSCFIWSSASIDERTRIVKTGVIVLESTSGGVMLRNITALNIKGGAAITSCDPDCKIPAIVSGINIQDLPQRNTYNSCPHNPSDLTGLVEPYEYNPQIANQDLTSRVFNNINNTQELLSKLSTDFRVRFDNNGNPTGINGTYTSITDQNGSVLQNAINVQNPPSYDVCSASHNTCIASTDSVRCTGNDPLVYIWNNGVYLVQPNQKISIGGTDIIPGTTIARCNAIDMGNATINVSNFTGGGPIAGNQINLGYKNGDASNATFIAKNGVVDMGNNIQLTNVNIFSKNIELDENGLVWNGGLLYSGGPGQDNFNINLNANSRLGTASNPVLIISNGSSLGIQRNGNAEINGLVFATDNVNNLSISGNGDFAINGSIVSNSRNNNINITGNFSINFKKNIIDNLVSKYGFLKPVSCKPQAMVKQQFIQTKALSY